MTESPKSEIRRPKEGRGLKSEAQVGAGLLEIESAFLNWGDETNADTIVILPPMALDERTALFGEAIIRFAKKIPQNPVNNRLIEQLVGAGTSIGANYREADDAVSGKEFKLRMGTSRKESKETTFFLRMIAVADERLAPEARVLWREAKEVNLIFGAIWRK